MPIEIDLGKIFLEILNTAIKFWPVWLAFAGLLVFKLLLDHLDIKIDKWFFNKRYGKRKNIQELRSLTPTQFEKYIANLFEKLGYKTKTTGGSYDGGVDVIAIKGDKTHYIQCKKYITRQVPVGAVRDFYGAIADKADATGYFITTHTFTAEALKFAEDKPIELIDQFKLLEYMKLAGIEEVPKPNKKLCPKCGGALIERKGKFGMFLGCNNYPKCRYTTGIN